MEGAGSEGADGGKRGNSGVSISLVLLAGSAAFHIFPYEGGKARPPELSGDKLAGFQETRVSGGFVVVTSLHNGVAEGGIRGNIDTVLVGQEAINMFPVGETGMEGRGNRTIHRLEAL